MINRPARERRVDRLGALLGPERLAAVMAGVVVAVVISIGWSGQRGGGPPPVSSASPSQPIQVASALPSPTANNSSAVVVLGMIDEVVALESDLEQARSAQDAARVGVVLRHLNASIVARDGALTTMASDPSRAGLAIRIRTASESILDASRTILQAATANTDAYLEGAAEVVSMLKTLPSLRNELAAAMGRSPMPDIHTPEPTGTAQSSAAPASRSSSP